MTVGRRSFLKVLGAVGLALSGVVAFFRRSAVSQAAPELALRNLRSTDAEHLFAIMNSCVSDADAFHGRCEPWSERWADVMARRRPDSVLITLDGLPVAFQEIPSIGPPVDPAPDDAGEEELEKFALRDRDRRTFRLTAAGVRGNVLAADEAVRMFRRVLYYGARAARELGYEYLECAAPWEKHPRLPRAWTDYAGCELTEPESVSEVDGRRVYWLRWRLADMVDELAREGAGQEGLDAL